MSDRHPVDEVIRTSVAAQVPPEVEARLRQQFIAFRTRLGRRRHPVRERLASLVGQPPLRWAAAGAVLATVLTIVLWGGPGANRVYAAAVSRLATARTVQYTMDIAPFVSVAFSHLAPAHERITTSWGIEIRTDGSGAQLVLLHGSKQFVREQKDASSLLRTADLIEQLSSLPRTPDSRLGERTLGGRRFVGFRVMGTRMPGPHGVQSLDLWIDAASGALDHVDVRPAGAGTSEYALHIRDIRVDAAVDPALFDMTPPPGYADAASRSSAEQSDREPADLTLLQPHITQAVRQSAVVVPMSGPYLQASAAADSVSRYLQQRGVVPVGPAFGRFESESHWEVGYPVPEGTTTEPPFEMITMPDGPVASVVVNGPWGQDSSARWSRLLAWVAEHGYIAAGPPIEVWSGDATEPDAQRTEMRIAVAPARR